MDTRGFEAAIDALVAGTRSADDVAQDVDAGIEMLPALVPYLKGDLPIEALERIEALVKAIIDDSCKRRVTGAEARRIALFQQQVGFLLKYKPYAVKCANPLGYSLFLENPGEGFSFQRHTEHKVEVFHIIDVLPGGYAFLCDFDEWQQVFEPESFARWLGGAADERYDRYRYELSAGDVLVIDELNVVHTVIGCVVEEFATVSTDMVDRLYDQNASAQVPADFTREFVRSRLAEIRYPSASRVVHGESPGEIVAERVEGGSVRVLSDSFVTASAYSVDPRSTGPALHDRERAASVYVTGGAGEFVIADAEEMAAPTAPPAIAVAAGDLLTIVPGVHYRAINRAGEPLTFSEHRIAPGVAFGPEPT
jgi:mannose-6-phosphate isomerase-like protein (cupin superfamily)